MTTGVTVRPFGRPRVIATAALAALVLALAVPVPAFASHNPDIAFESDVSAAEGNGGSTTMTFTVWLSEMSPTEAITVDFETVDFTAVAGEDYAQTSGTLVFPPGITEREISVTVHGDTDLEDNEEFLVGLSNASHGRLVDGDAIGTILNDDGPAISVADGEGAEGDGDAGGQVTFEVTLAAAVDHAVEVDYATADGTATAGSDYEATADTLTFAPYETSQTVSVPVIGDDADEDDETFTLRLTNATGGSTIARERATGTIRDDDAAAVLAVDDLTVAELDDELGAWTHMGQFIVRVVGATNHDITFEYTTVNETATGGPFLATGDYKATSGSANIEAGDTEVLIEVPITRDSTPEPHETFLLRLADVTGADAPDPEARGTIQNDDAAITVEDAEVEEGDDALTTFEVAIDYPTIHEVTVHHATASSSSGNPAAAGSDYEPTDGTTTIPADETSATVDVVVLDDPTDEPDETFQLQLSTATNATIADGAAIATILDDDAPPSLTVVDVPFMETHAGQTTRAVTVNLSAASAKDITVDWATRDGTATAGSDYLAASGTVQFAKGQTEATVDVTIQGDTVAEPDESFHVDLSEPANATLADDSGTVTIVNDDATLSIDDVTVVETDDPTSVDVTVRLGQAPPPGETVTVDYATSDGSAADGVDYDGVSGTLTFGEGDTVRTITVPIHGDEIGEVDETFDMTLSNADGAVISPAGREATVTILDDDQVNLRVNDAAVIEGDGGTATLEFDVSLSLPSDEPVRFDWATSNGTAEASELVFTRDYEAVSGSGQIPAGETNTTLSVTVNGDTAAEAHETLNVTLSDASGIDAVTDATAVGTIRNDDTVVAVADATANEGDNGTTGMAFVVTLSRPSAEPVTVEYATADGTATAGEDYQAASATLTVPAETVEAAVVVQVIADTVDEADETIALEVADPAAGDGVTVADGEAVGTIQDDDPAPAVSIDDLSVHEGDHGSTAAVVGVALSHASDRTVTVTYVTEDGTATAGSDYGAADGTVTFLPGETQATVVATVHGDLLVEEDEWFRIRLGEAENAVVADAFGVVTISNDDAAAPPTTPPADPGGDPDDDPAPDAGTVGRSFGLDRIETAVQVSRDHWPTGKEAAAADDPATDAILARADKFPDALAAGPLAASLDAPLLLTHSDALPEIVAAELARLGVERVWLLGGKAAISGEVEGELVDAGYDVERIAGEDRFATAAAVAEKVGRAATGEVVLALGHHEVESRSWPDALSAGALSASPHRLPVLLTAPSVLPAATAEALNSLDPTKVWILGGTAAVSAAVEDELEANGRATARLAGHDRYHTSVTVAAEALRHHAAGEVPVVFATGSNFPDGLAAGALAARLGAVLVLVPQTRLSDAPTVRSFLVDHADRFDNGVVVGGSAVVSDAVRAELAEAMTAP